MIFSNFVIEFNYLKSKLKAFQPNSYEYKICRKCFDLDLHFFRKKPYVKNNGVIEDTLVSLNLVVESGSGDALWIFADKKKGIMVPEKSFPDFLGFEMGGSVYGQRSRIKSQSG